jgi:membrane dipeptidase
VIDGHNDVATWIHDFGFDIGMDGDEPGDRGPLIYAVGPLTWLPNRPYGENVGTDIDIIRAREGGLDAQFFSIWIESQLYESGVPGQSRQRALDKIESLRESVSRNSGAIEFADTVLDVERIVSNGKLAALIGIEGGQAIENDLENLRRFYELGVRRMTLTQDISHSWADSSRDVATNNGLSEFGSEVVREMNRLGMIVDVSHVSDETFWDVLKVTGAPVIASHSSARAIADHPRNLTDDMIQSVAANNGVVMVNFSGLFIDPEKTTEWKVFLGWHWFTHPKNPDTPLAVLIDHIEHMVEVSGIDHVGLGSDFDGGAFFPKNLKDVGDLPNITVELVRRGYSDEDILKILGGNVLRVLADVERVATQPSKD